jgi:hypothetical protein
MNHTSSQNKLIWLKEFTGWSYIHAYRKGITSKDTRTFLFGKSKDGIVSNNHHSYWDKP